MPSTIKQIQQGADDAVVLCFEFDNSVGCCFKVIDCSDYAERPCQLKLKDQALEIRLLDNQGDVEEVVWRSEALLNAKTLEVSPEATLPQFLAEEKYRTEEYTVFANRQEFEQYIVKALQTYPLQQVSLLGLVHICMFLHMSISDLAGQVLQVLAPARSS